MRILGVDPGGTTGLTLVNTSNEPWRVSPSQVDFRGGVAALYLLFKDTEIDGVAVEKYTIAPRTLSRTRQTDALEMIGFVRGLCILHGVEFKLQTPADAKLVWSDVRLKENGLWVPKQEHARDALRHALTYLQRLGVTPPK